MIKLSVLRNKERPKGYRIIVEAAAKNLRLSKRATKLLMFYCDQKDGFRPSTRFIEKKTGIKKNKVSEIRRELMEHGVIEYIPERKTTVLWHAIRAFSMINLTSGKRLNKDESCRAEFFSYRKIMQRPKKIGKLVAENKRIWVGDASDDEEVASVEIDIRTLRYPEIACEYSVGKEVIARASALDTEISRRLEDLYENEYVMMVTAFSEYDPTLQQEQIECEKDQILIGREERWYDPFKSDDVFACEDDTGIEVKIGVHN